MAAVKTDDRYGRWIFRRVKGLKKKIEEVSRDTNSNQPNPEDKHSTWQWSSGNSTSVKINCLTGSGFAGSKKPCFVSPWSSPSNNNNGVVLFLLSALALVSAWSPSISNKGSMADIEEERFFVSCFDGISCKRILREGKFNCVGVGWVPNI